MVLVISAGEKWSSFAHSDGLGFKMSGEMMSCSINVVLRCFAKTSTSSWSILTQTPFEFRIGRICVGGLRAALVTLRKE